MALIDEKFLHAIRVLSSISLEKCDGKQALATLLEQVVKLMNFQAGLILIEDGLTHEIKALSIIGTMQEDIDALVSKWGKEIVDRNWEEKCSEPQKLIISDSNCHEWFAGWRSERSFVSFPLGVDRLRGAILLFSQPDITATSHNLEDWNVLARAVQLSLNNRLLEVALEQTQGMITNQKRNFMSLLSITEAMGESVSPQKLLDFAVKPIQEVTDFGTVAVRIYNREENCFRLVTQLGMTPEMIEKLECVSGDEELMHEVISFLKPCIRRELNPASQKSGFRTLIHVPIVGHEKLLGTIDLADKSIRQTSEDEILWLVLVGRIIGTLMRQVYLMERIRDLAIIKERSFIAQEIHDSLAQLISMIHVWTVSGKVALESQEYQNVQAALDTVDSISGEAYDILREEMLSLRDTIRPNESIIPVLDNILDRYKKMWGIQTQLFTDLFDKDSLRLPLTNEEKIQLLRMIQEALVNVRKHAHASAIQVHVWETVRFIQVTIKDDGSGFDPANISMDSLGLQIIRDRAASIGSEVTISSQIGHGTTVNITVPKKVDKR
jgi:two-component system nitrate/nitrite sensor histidine kinase NarX